MEYLFFEATWQLLALYHPSPGLVCLCQTIPNSSHSSPPPPPPPPHFLLDFPPLFFSSPLPRPAFLTFSLRLIYYLRRRSSGRGSGSSCSRVGGTDLQLAKSCGLFWGVGCEWGGKVVDDGAAAVSHSIASERKQIYNTATGKIYTNICMYICERCHLAPPAALMPPIPRFLFWHKMNLSWKVVNILWQAGVAFFGCCCVWISLI